MTFRRSFHRAVTRGWAARVCAPGRRHARRAGREREQPPLLRLRHLRHALPEPPHEVVLRAQPAHVRGVRAPVGDVEVAAAAEHELEVGHRAAAPQRRRDLPRANTLRELAFVNMPTA